MKYIFRIIAIALLIAVAVIYWNHTSGERAKEAKERAEQQEMEQERQRALDDEAAFAKSIDLEELRNPAYPQFSQIQTQVRVLKIDPTGPAATCYGLQKGDRVDGSEADLRRHYMHGENIDIWRDGSALTLPAPGTTPRFPKPPPVEKPAPPEQHIPIS